MNRFSPAVCIIILACQLVSGSLAHADEVSDACDYVSRKVSTFKGDIYRQESETLSMIASRVVTFCLVSRSWDRRGPSDPRVVPSPLFLITARCAKAMTYSSRLEPNLLALAKLARLTLRPTFFRLDPYACLRHPDAYENNTKYR
jgi:hypothetical protein